MIASSNETQANNSGLGAMLRLLGVFGILAAAILGALLVLEIIPRALFGEYLTKSLLVVVIAGLAITAISFITRAGK